MQKRGRYWVALQAAGTVGAVLTLAACGSADFAQFNTPKFDVAALIPPDPDEFARKQRALEPAGPNDLVDGNGVCVGGDGAATGTPSEQASDPQGQQAMQAAPAAPRGVALEMTECEVVRAAGRPAEVQISANAAGERTVTMIYATPERPIYRFVSGRLRVVERGAEPAPEPGTKKPARRPARRTG